MKINANATALLLGTAAILSVFPVNTAWAQGCIVARSNGDVGGPESQGGYMQAGDFDFGIGYRHQFSYKHFVGPTEQVYRTENGNNVENKINLENFSITYQISSRFLSVSADIPLLSASRHTHNSPIVYTSSGIGDMSVMANGWLWNPAGNTKGNVQLGIGILFPTGKDNVSNAVASAVGGAATNSIVDYSIQPGQGGFGIPFQWVAFKNVRDNQLYFNGTYTAMLSDINAVLRTGAAANPLTLVQHNAISDQYLLEAGIAHPISRIKGLTFTFGPRFEGVPARNLFPTGNNLGFRRPGFAISLEPGFQYVHGNNVLTAQIGKAFYRDRTVSVPDSLTGGHGDAAFADWVWLASYSFRVPSRAHAAAEHSAVPSHSAAQTASGS